MRNGMWTEKGVGDVKLLRHATAERTRLVMRKERTSVIIAKLNSRSIMIARNKQSCRDPPDLQDERGFR